MRLATGLVCCPECGARVPYRHDGLTEPHAVAEELECPAGFPPYVVATKSGTTPTPLHALLVMAEAAG